MPRHVHKVAKTKSSKAIVKDLQEARQAKMEAKKELMEHNAAIKLHSEQVMLPEQKMQKSEEAFSEVSQPSTSLSQATGLEANSLQSSANNLPVPVSELVTLEPKAPENALTQATEKKAEKVEQKQETSKVQTAPVQKQHISSEQKIVTKQSSVPSATPLKQPEPTKQKSNERPTFEKNSSESTFGQSNMNKPLEVNSKAQSQAKSEQGNDVSPLWTANMTRMTEQWLGLQMQMVSMMTDSWIKLLRGSWFPPSPMND